MLTNYRYWYGRLHEKVMFYNQKKKGGGVGGVPPPVVTKKEFDTTRKREKRGPEGRVSANSKFGVIH